MRRLATLSLICLTAAACSDAQPVTVTQVYTNLRRFNQLVGVFHPNDGGTRLYALEQRGIISSFDGANATDTTRFLDIRQKITAGGEMGLLGLAFDPNFANTGFFYLNFTRTTRIGDVDQLQTIIARYRTKNGNPLVADTASEEILLVFNQPYENHNGGHIAFGPDGYLYIATGDGGAGGDPQGNGQNRATLLGKILRIDVRTTQGNLKYAIPADNPFVGNGQGYREEIYAYGLRNPWRFSFDPPTGMLWTGDVGQNAWEEIDIIEKGKNYGWNEMEGFHCYPPGSGCDTTGLTLPVWEYPHDTTGGISVTGGYVYRGTSAPVLAGKYVYGDFNGKVWALTYNPTTRTATNQFIRHTGSPVSSFGLDHTGELLVCGYDGRIFKFESAASGVEEEQGRTAATAIRFINPNPMTSEAAVTFALGSAGHVRLTLHDVTGKEVATIFDGNREAGEHRVIFNAGKLPSAAYLCRLASQGVVAIQQVMLAR